jgi:hypothetical protein
MKKYHKIQIKHISFLYRKQNPKKHNSYKALNILFIDEKYTFFLTENE